MDAFLSERFLNATDSASQQLEVAEDDLELAIAHLRLSNAVNVYRMLEAEPDTIV